MKRTTSYFPPVGHEELYIILSQWFAINHSEGSMVPCHTLGTSAALRKVENPLQDLKNPSLFAVEDGVILWKQLPSSSARTRLKFLGSTIAMFDFSVANLIQAECFIRSWVCLFDESLNLSLLYTVGETPRGRNQEFMTRPFLLANR